MLNSQDNNHMEQQFPTNNDNPNFGPADNNEQVTEYSRLWGYGFVENDNERSRHLAQNPQNNLLKSHDEINSEFRYSPPEDDRSFEKNDEPAVYNWVLHKKQFSLSNDDEIYGSMEENY